MKQIDNRQKELIQSRAQRALKSSKNPFVMKGKEKEHIHLPSEKSTEETVEEKKEASSESTVHHSGPKIGRNDPCPCGSGKKYKKCCLNKPSPEQGKTT